MKLTRKEFLRIAGLAALGATTGCSGGGANGPDVNPPPKPLEEYKTLKNLVGDIHIHTNLSDGDESPDFALRYARDTSGLDFCCITDHGEQLSDNNWAGLPYYRSMPGKYDDPGKFCVLFGYEWTSSRTGHRNVYTIDNQLPIFQSNKPVNAPIDILWNGLQGHEAIAIPHHTMIPSGEKWWDLGDPGLEPVVEFSSKWGYSLYYGNERPIRDAYAPHAIYEALQNGKRYGIIASSDSHMSRPGCYVMEDRPDTLRYPQPGLVYVWATAHTRDAIYQALKNRRCYGSSGTRVNLQFAVNGAVMGSEITSASAPKISYKVSSPETISRLTIQKIGNLARENLLVLLPEALQVEGDFTDPGFTGDCAYTIRVDFANSDAAITSPIWVTMKTAASLL